LSETSPLQRSGTLTAAASASEPIFMTCQEEEILLLPSALLRTGALQAAVFILPVQVIIAAESA
jgi:hypothetical protein